MDEAPELTTFGALIRHALWLEATAAGFYDAAGPGLGALASQLAAEHRERQRIVERARQQYLNEVILEPISGLDGHEYVIDGTPPDAGGAAARAVELEERSGRYYRESAAVAKSLLAEAARTFRKLGEGNAGIVERLKVFGGK